MDQRVIALPDDFTHHHLDRRLFFERATQLVGSSAAAMSLLASFRSNYARAETLAARDPKLVTEFLDILGPACVVNAYLARPKGEAKLPGSMSALG